jgi:hypothetical protein
MGIVSIVNTRGLRDRGSSPHDADDSLPAVDEHDEHDEDGTSAPVVTLADVLVGGLSRVRAHLYGREGS